MRKFSILSIGLLILGISVISGPMQPVAAQVSQAPVLEDNPARINDGDAAEVLAAGDVSEVQDVVNANAGAAAEAPAANAARPDEVRIENVLQRPSFQDARLDDDDDERGHDRRGRNRGRGGADKILDIDGMVAAGELGEAVFGVDGSGEAISIESGKASLDRDMTLKVQVKGLRSMEAGTDNTRFSAGVACLGSGLLKATGGDSEEGDDFSLDENGDGNFEGQVDLQGSSCIAPTVMILNEQDQLVAIAGHSAPADDDEDDDNQGRGNQEDDDQDDDRRNRDEGVNEDPNDDRNADGQAGVDENNDDRADDAQVGADDLN